MNCPFCGAQIPDGAAFCPNCGAPSTPQQAEQQQTVLNGQPQAAPGPQYQQQPQAAPDPQYQQQPYGAPGPQYQQQPYGAAGQPQPAANQQWQQKKQSFAAAGQQSFVDSVKGDPIKICTLVGFFFTFLGSFLPAWVSAGGIGVGLFAGDGGILKLYGILFLFGSIFGILLEFSSHAQGLKALSDAVKKLPYSQFYIPGLFFIVYLLARFNGNFRLVVSFGASWGFAKWICLIGVLLLFVRPVMKLIKKEEYWA